MNRNIRRGWLATEAAVGIVLMMLLGVLAADALFRFHDSGATAYWRQACIWAVDAQLQRIQAGAPLDSQPPAGVLPEGLTLRTTSAPGEGQWQGLTRVTVTASVLVPRVGTIHERMSGYIARESKP